MLFLLVRRTFGPVAGLTATFAVVITPVAIADNRNNTIDSLLVLTLLLATWAVFRAAESGRLRWLLLGMLGAGIGPARRTGILDSIGPAHHTIDRHSTPAGSR